MKLGLINASPRGRASNSRKILSWLTRDLPKSVETTTVYAVKAEDQDKALSSIADCDAYAMSFPLYTDAMPGICKRLMENMLERKSDFAGKPILFIIHSGFPEMRQNRVLERYVAHFAHLMDMPFLGCVIMGGSESIRFAPQKVFTTRIDALAAIGVRLPGQKPFSPEELLMPGAMEVLPAFVMFLFKGIAVFMDGMWNRMLKKNNVFKDRRATPYQ